MKGKRSWDQEHHVKALVLLVLLFTLSAAAQVAPPSNSRDQEDFRISVDVDLVVLQATVRDRAGHTVMELHRDDFTVFEDGKPQPPPIPA